MSGAAGGLRARKQALVSALCMFSCGKACLHMRLESRTRVLSGVRCCSWWSVRSTGDICAVERHTYSCQEGGVCWKVQDVLYVRDANAWGH
jgi:hypothetical protein